MQHGITLVSHLPRSPNTSWAMLDCNSCFNIWAILLAHRCMKMQHLNKPRMVILISVDLYLHKLGSMLSVAV